MQVIPKIGDLVRFHFSAMTLDEAKTYGVNINKFSHVGRVVEVFGRDSRFAKVDCKALGRIVTLDSAAIFAIMEQRKGEKSKDPLEALAEKFNNNRNK